MALFQESRLDHSNQYGLLNNFFKGLFCIRYPDMMLESEMRTLINDWLTRDCAPNKKVEVIADTFMFDTHHIVHYV